MNYGWQGNRTGRPAIRIRGHGAERSPEALAQLGRNLKSEIAISSFPWIRNPNLPWV